MKQNVIIIVLIQFSKQSYLVSLTEDQVTSNSLNTLSLVSGYFLWYCYLGLFELFFRFLLFPNYRRLFRTVPFYPVMMGTIITIFFSFFFSFSCMMQTLFQFFTLVWWNIFILFIMSSYSLDQVVHLNSKSAFILCI